MMNLSKNYLQLINRKFLLFIPWFCQQYESQLVLNKQLEDSLKQCMDPEVPLKYCRYGINLRN